MSSFQTALSGLQAASTDLQVMGNNIANASTVGFKESNAQFADAYAAAIAGSAPVNSQIGVGTSVAAVAQQFSQGNIQSTNNPLDVAINGSGFFQFDYNGATVYGRNGQFHLDNSGYIVDSNGAKLIGVPATNGTLTSGSGPLQVVANTLAPSGTSKVALSMNLNASDTPIPSGTAFNPNDPTTYNYSTVSTVYDSLGNSHLMTTYYTLASGGTATSGQTWDVHYSMAGAYASGAATPGTSSSVFTGSGQVALSFDQNGRLLTSGTASTLVASGFAWSDGASGNAISVSFANSTNYSAADGVSSVNADGFGIGQLNNLSIGPDGTVQGIYSNGQTWTLGKVTLTNFASPQGLQRAGNNYYMPTAASGQPVTGTPSNNGLGVLQSNAVEESNVDLSTQLVSLIVAQQAYQANSQTIKTENQVVQTLLSL